MDELAERASRRLAAPDAAGSSGMRNEGNRAVTRRWASLVLALLPLAGGCGLDSNGLGGAHGADAARPLDAGAAADASRSDGGATDGGDRDAGAADAGSRDAGAGAPDAGAADAARPYDAGFDASVADAGPGDVLIEAENYDRTASADGFHMWLTETSLAGYSGTGYVVARRTGGSYAWCDSGALATCGASVAYGFSVATGTYHVHVRATGSGSGADSIWWAADAAAPTSHTIDSTSTWTWTDLGTATLAAGPHTLTIYMREPGAELDRIFISASASPPG